MCEGRQIIFYEMLMKSSRWGEMGSILAKGSCIGQTVAPGGKLIALHIVSKLQLVIVLCGRPSKRLDSLGYIPYFHVAVSIDRIVDFECCVLDRCLCEMGERGRETPNAKCH